MTTTTAPGFPFTTRRTTTPIQNLDHGTRGSTTATITTATPRGTGSSLRMTLSLRADNGATTVATIDSDVFLRTPGRYRRPGLKVEVRGIVRHLPHAPPAIEAVGINPA